MKHFTLKIILLGLFLNFFLNSTGQNIGLESNDKDEINTILVQFFPYLFPPTQILLDISNNELTFYRFGAKERLLPPSDPADSLKPDYDPNVCVEKFPNCIHVKLKNKDFKFLMDSIIYQFNLKDFQDSISNCCEDGISIYMFTTFYNAELKETELYNYLSFNQIRLFNFLLDIINENNSEKITEEYLERLKKLIRSIRRLS